MMKAANIFKGFLIAAIFLATGCSNNNELPEGSAKKGTTHDISQNLLNWNKRQKITLLPHQLIPINYLEKHPEIKGLLVYHYLGTGKTYLALGYAERNPSKKIVLLVPRFLKGHWLKNMRSYGVSNSDRYQIVTHKEAAKLVNKDLSNTIVIIDESHRIIRKLDSLDPKVADMYSKLYLNIRKSKRILSLTGTPIFGDVTDIAYQINLVSGKEIIPYNKEDFRVAFMDINQHKSATIGYLAQSKVTPMMLALTGAMVAGTTAGMTIAFPIAMFAGYMMPYAIESFFPIKTNPLRSFNVEALEKIGSKYITYYDFDNINKKYYPTKEVHYESVSYNNFQLDILMRFADSQLTTKEVMQLQKDEDISYGKDYASLNSTKLQDIMKKRPGRGLEIGNLIHRNPHNKKEIIYPYKFKEAVDLMLSTNGPVVLYSHFYHNGILLFKQYLDSRGQKGRYAILHPDAPVDKYEEIVNKYNEGKLKYLLIHPEITEGISLVGTRQLHILETPYNKSFQEQIIGRAVRYRSHMHLPEKERHVDVHIWRPTFPKFDLPHGAAIRTNWQRNFQELNYYGERSLVDANTDMKTFTPDDLAFSNMNLLDKNMESLVDLLKQYSIETSKEVLR